MQDSSSGKSSLKHDSEFKDLLKEVKFRWKKYVSNAHGARIIEMGAKNPHDSIKIEKQTYFTISSDSKSVSESEKTTELLKLKGFAISPAIKIARIQYDEQAKNDPNNTFLYTWLHNASFTSA